MIAPPDMRNPFTGVNNPAFPVHDGGVAGTFNAFGWVRELFTTAIPSYIGDMNYYAGGGVGPA